MAESTQVQQINLTENAAKAIKELLESRNLENYGLRVFVAGSGCSGYQYGMSLDDKEIENDTISEQFGVKLIVDDISIAYLQGATIDYQDNEMGTGFKIDNPNNMASSCGCGSGAAKSEDSCGCGSGNGGGGCGYGC